MNKLLIAIKILTVSSCLLPILSAAHGQEVMYSGKLDLPPIARFRELPMRMKDELSVEFPDIGTEMQPGITQFFVKILSEQSEPELLSEAAASLGRIAREGYDDVAAAVQPLEGLLTNNDKRVRRAAAMALIDAQSKDSAGKLLDLCEISDARLRVTIETTLADWEFAAAKETWLKRLQDKTFTSSTLKGSACRGLAKLGAKDTIDTIVSVHADLNQPFAVRAMAAKAIGMLDPEKARGIASKLKDGSVADRLMATSLLTCDDTASLEQLSEFCADESNAVAAAAWRELERLKPELLRDKLQTGSTHADSQVRLAAIRVLQRYPSEDGTNLLSKLTGDRHINVRNDARVVLLEHAEESTDLATQAVANAEQGVTPDNNWEQIEQSLIILAARNQAQVTEKSVPLLEHERPEVYVTAAWAMHLYPNALVLPEVTKIAEKRRNPVSPTSPPELQRNIGFQMAHLYQMAGYLEHKPFMDMCKKEFNKGSGLNRDGRAAGMWAIGMLNKGNPDADLVKQLRGRLNDRAANIPEFELVRRMALMSIGRMGAKSEVTQVRHAYDVDSTATVIPESARWVLRRLGESDIPPEKKLKGVNRSIGGWKVAPIPK